MVVWQVAAGAGWGERSGLQSYLPVRSQGNSKLAAVGGLKPTPAQALSLTMPPTQTPAVDDEDEALAPLLKSLKLLQYLGKLQEKGCELVSDVRDMTLEDLIGVIGMKFGHAKRLINHFSQA